MDDKVNKRQVIRKELMNMFSTSTGMYMPLKKDQFTGLPTLISIFPRLKKAMSKGAIGMVYIDLVGFTDIESIYGRDLCNQILLNTGSALNGLNMEYLGSKHKLGVCSLGADDFLIFIEKQDHSYNYQEEYPRLKQYIEKAINQANQALGINRDLCIHLGYVILKERYGYQTESLIYAAVKEATYAAKNYANVQEHAQRQLMKQILTERTLQIVYQPIVSLGSGGVFGFEALTRGPVNTYFESPENLFNAAEQFQCLFDLESACHELAVKNASSQLGDRYLFINVNPLTLNAANHKKGRTRAILREYGIDFSKVVLELTERTAIKDYDSFREALHYYRNQGFLIAIDDAGAGYSSLQAIAELQPEFVKVDMSLIRNIDKDATKEAILETFVNFSYKISSRVICEGIENETELKVLTEMGCDYGQGFLLGRPGTMEQNIDSRIREKIQLSSDERRVNHSSSGKKIGDIIMCHQSIKPDVPVHLVVDMFKDKKFINGLVVCEDMIPIGLIMREKLSTMLGIKYGYDLFMKRSVSAIMDNNPLVLPWFTPIEEAARQVAERHDKGLTDYVVVTRENTYQGVVSVAKMIDTMASIHIEQAKDANPLTGLPGNRCITERITRNLAQGEDIVVLYFDLDNFKAFNDYYGFEHGDRAIGLLAKIISQVVKEYGNEHDLVGHIGGDDFLVISTPDKHQVISSQVIELFDRSIIDLYDRQAVQNGYIMAHNRKGQISTIPIMTVSIAGVFNDRKSFKSHLQLGEIAAEIKKKAKAQNGSCYYFDRRNYEGETD